MSNTNDDIDEKKQGSAKDNTMGLMADDDMDIILAAIEKQPLVSNVLSLNVLLKEFKDHNNFTRQMKVLISNDKHTEYRQMRRDGNCFYRAFLLGLFETIEQNKDIQLLTKVSQNIMTSLHRLLKFGYESFTIEDFYYAFLDELQFYQRKLESDNPDKYQASDNMGNTAIERLGNSSHANYLIFWARMLSSLYMRENQDDFIPFIPSNKGGFDKWLKSDVEALKSEADHLQTVALSKSINVPINIYCLENIQKGGPQTVQTIPNEKAKFDLLFRPGHYDVLYRKNMNKSSNNNNNNNNNVNTNTNMNKNKNKNNNNDNNNKSNNDTLQSASTDNTDDIDIDMMNEKK